MLMARAGKAQAFTAPVQELTSNIPAFPYPFDVRHVLKVPPHTFLLELVADYRRCNFSSVNHMTGGFLVRTAIHSIWYVWGNMSNITARSIAYCPDAHSSLMSLACTVSCSSQNQFHVRTFMYTCI
jgi:hypothetical protein